MKRILVLFGLICTVVTMTAQVEKEKKIETVFIDVPTGL